ncbi:MAG: Xaa-Pro aminopeptidase [Halobacteriovorax sp.]|nr:Xaa-Pro aminopeptidase [Halobacteriovorax sp.]|tara:strand:- start:244306 stop:245631 length:1326 start_codon:yes stop_codon:yes gene_type:complete
MLSELKNRREKLIALLNGAAAVFPATTHQKRSNDTEFPFRQCSNFFYLTNLHEPDAFFVITPKGKTAITTLFVRPKDPAMEQWTGLRLGTEKAKELTGVDQCFEIGDFDKMLPELLTGHDTVAYDFYESERIWSNIHSALKTLRRKRNSTEPRPLKTLDLSDLIGRLRLVKSDYELEQMRKAAVITDKAHRAAMAMSAPGKTEKEVHALMEYIFLGHGGDGNAYDNIVATGENGLILHYVENDQEIKDGDTLLIDAGCQFNLYASDVTRTFPANGKFSDAQKELYQICLDAQLSCLSFAGPGKTLKEVHHHAVEVLVEGMLKLGIMTGDKDILIKEEKFKTYYPHGTGHWLGLDVHDQSPYLDETWELTKLAPGMCFTIEPGLYIPKDDSSVPEKYRGLSVRIEDDIVITENGIENLTAFIPKTIEEVEAACTGDYREFLP